VYAVGCAGALRHSRFVRWIPHEETGTEPEAWLSWLLDGGRTRLGGAVLLPCNDEAVELIAKNRAALGDHFVLPDADEVALAMLDKARLYDVASRIGIPTPRTWIVNGRRDLVAALPELSYPCILKPRVSHAFRKRFGAKVFVAGDERQLLERFDDSDAAGLQMILCEIVPGNDDQYCSYWTYVDGAGKPRFHMTKRKLRQYPVHFGGGTFHVTEWNAEVAEIGLRLVTGAGLRGLAAVEFKRDCRDGELKLIECNVRFTSAIEIAPRSGTDLALLVYNDLTGRPLPATNGFRDGVTLWFPFLDYCALRSYRSAGELSLADWLRTLRGRPSVAWLHWTDPFPAIAAGYDRLRRGSVAS
ncbi:MAG: hypothetical protein ACREQY_01595, partial [Candidatus Binatia bacterium]